MTNLLIFSNKIVLYLCFLLAKNNFFLQKRLHMLSGAKKYNCWEKETKKFLLLCERIVIVLLRSLLCNSNTIVKEVNCITVILLQNYSCGFE